MIDAQPHAALPAIGEAIAQGLQAYAGAKGFAVPIVAIIGSSVWPSGVWRPTCASSKMTKSAG
jgi:hypothetical protein